jgi:hypothetical protein
MAATQLSFSLRTTANVQTVHLIGSWDGYHGQLPLSRNPSKSAGAWVGTFRFQNTVLQPGERYWYYYIMDGYHVSHDPAHEHTVEPTTGRKLNILDVPRSKSSKSSSSSASKRQSRRYSREVPQGRSLSPSQIKCPMPYKPGLANHLTTGYTQDMLDQLSHQFAQVTVEESEESDSDCESDVPSLSSGSSRSSNCSSPSTISSTSSNCTCERYGITRSGDRVKLDCGGDRCGSADGSSCSSESEEEYTPQRRYARRQGVVVRH